ncbi:MAG: hypothetical protein AB1546_04950, partial [bacterium]
PSSNRVGLPLVHEDDAGRAFHLALKKNAHGAFNVAAGNLPFKELGATLGKPVVGLPYPVMRFVSDTGYLLGAMPVSSHWAVLMRHPFELNCEKAKRDLGWTPRRTPGEAFREMVAAWKTR